MSGLVEAIEPLRGTCKRIGFKLFLREDLLAIAIQNRSHLDASTVELKWEPSDLWALTLNIFWESETFRACVLAINPSVSPGKWPAEEIIVSNCSCHSGATKWNGATKFKQLASSNVVPQMARTVFSLGRSYSFFRLPSEHQRKLTPVGNRVLRSASILRGYNVASEKRVADLRKEYVTLSRYLDGLKGRNPTGTNRGNRRRPAESSEEEDCVQAWSAHRRDFAQVPVVGTK